VTSPGAHRQVRVPTAVLGLTGGPGDLTADQQAVRFLKRLVPGCAPRAFHRPRTVGTTDPSSPPPISRGSSAVARFRRPETPSLRYALDRWSSTVLVVTKRACAISRFDEPAAASSATRSSLGVSAAGPVRRLRRGRNPATRSSAAARSASGTAPQNSASSSARVSRSRDSVRRPVRRTADPRSTRAAARSSRAGLFSTTSTASRSISSSPVSVPVVRSTRDSPRGAPHRLACARSAASRSRASSGFPIRYAASAATVRQQASAGLSNPYSCQTRPATRAAASASSYRPRSSRIRAQTSST
jgi:hypothetical protein